MSRINPQILKSSNPQISAVLLSGGVDSAVLVAEEARRAEVQPIYVNVGLAWEAAERRMVGALLASEAMGSRVRPLAALSVDMSDVYASTHWAIQGRPPAYHTPDEDVYLPGRNIVLLGKAGIYCAKEGIERMVIGTLESNPFPDGTEIFRSAMASALSIGLGRAVQIDAPYANLSKAEVIRRGTRFGVPLALTLSCMSPALPSSADVLPRHCGLCSKCRERHDAFLEAGVEDPTHYVDRENMT